MNRALPMIGLVALVPALGAAQTAPERVEIAIQGELVEQLITVTGANLNNIDPNTGQPYQFEVDEYNRILAEEVEEIPVGANVIARGYAASSLFLRESLPVDADTTPEQVTPVIIGPGSSNGAASVGGTVVASGQFPGGAVYAVDDSNGVLVPGEIEVPDAGDFIAIVGRRTNPCLPDDPDELALILRGPIDWFENTAPGQSLDFSQVLQSGVTYFAENYAAGCEKSLFLEDALALGDGVPTVTGLTPNSGLTEDDPLLPDDPTGNAEGGFDFTVDPDNTAEERVVNIDPVIAVGYRYAVSGATFSGVVMPSPETVADSDGYTVLVDGQRFPLPQGGNLSFLAEGLTGVTSFEVRDIDESLMLDPTDPQAFVTGVTLTDQTAQISISQTPITVDTDARKAVPLPAIALGALGGLLAFGALRRR